MKITKKEQRALELNFLLLYTAEEKAYLVAKQKEGDLWADAEKEVAFLAGYRAGKKEAGR